MLHYPDTMRKAQAEIDAVVGSSRMPDFDDAEALPYVRALISEVMRCVRASYAADFILPCAYHGLRDQVETHRAPRSPTQRHRGRHI